MFGLFGKSKQDKAADLMQTGARAVGTVLSVNDTGMTINDNPRVKMVFRLEPLDGSAAFEAEKTKTVSRVEIPRAGDRYPVWYDQADPTTWMFAIIADDTGRATIRQLFGGAADTLTGMGGSAAAVAAAAPAAAPASDPLDRLQKLDALRASGALSDSEFQAQKAKILAEM